MNSPFAAFSSFGPHASAVGKKVKPGTAKRTLAFAAPYASLLGAFLLVVVLSSAVGTAYPLLYREIINSGIMKSDSPLIIRLAVLIAVLGVVDAALGILQTSLSAKVGSAIVLSLRSRLFQHIQTMPLAFFSVFSAGAREGIGG